MFIQPAQRGASYWGILAMVAIAAVGLQFGVVAGQAYLDDLTINKTIEDRVRAIANDQSGSEGKFMSTVQSQLEMNNMRTLKAEDIMTVQGSGSSLKIHKNYEVRKKFMGNIDLVMHYERIFDKANPAGQAVEQPSAPTPAKP